MMQLITIAMMSPTYQHTKVFSFGFEALCKTFLPSVVNEEKQVRIHDALCTAVGYDPETMKKEADAVEALATGKTENELLASEELQAIAAGDPFKYSFPLGAGLFTLMPLVGVEPGKETIQRWCTQLKLPSVVLEDDWRFFLDTKEKLLKGQEMMSMMAASTDRKQAEKGKDEVSKLKADTQKLEDDVQQRKDALDKAVAAEDPAKVTTTTTSLETYNAVESIKKQLGTMWESKE